MTCQIHKVHVPKPTTTLTWETPEGKVIEVCPTGFYNIQDRIEGLREGRRFRGRPGAAGDIARENEKWFAELAIVTDLTAPPSAGTT
jgi:hypothetical protein